MMQTQPDYIDYFAQRERQERAIAERCVDPSARSAHMRLAAEYRSRLKAAAPTQVLEQA